METYFSTFVAGAEPIITAALNKKPKNRLKILDTFPGLVVYETDYALRDIRTWQFFSNTFSLIRAYEDLGSRPMSNLVTALLKEKGLKRAISAVLPHKKNRVKLVAVEANKELTTRQPFLNKFERYISSIREVELSPREADYEFWLYTRKDGHGMFGLRQTYPDPIKRTPKKGELRKEVTSLLVLASKPTPKDVVLDPFAGSGAIPVMRAKSFPYKEIIAADGGKVQVEELKKAVQRARKKIKVFENDNFTFPNIKSSSVDKIITDPPWGKYKQFSTPIEKLYKTMLEEFYRVLRPGGSAVILMGAQEQFEEALRNTGASFRVIETYNILVSGRKATIYKICKD